MATYADVKDEAIKIIDHFSVHDEVMAGYLSPTTPTYSAKTSLASLGVNAYVRKAIALDVAQKMRARFGSSWHGVGVTDLKAADTIGAFIILMCKRTGIIAPWGEPT